MVYAVIGRLVVWGGRRYLRRRYGDRPQRVLAAALVGGGVLALVAAGRRAGTPS